MRWSYKEQRRFIEIAKSARSFDEVVKRSGRRPHSVRNAALRLGIKLAKRQNAPDYQLALALKANGK